MDGLQMKYFVLNPAKADAYGKASRKAMLIYAEFIKGENPNLAKDLFDWVRREQLRIYPDGNPGIQKIKLEDMGKL